MNFNGYFKKELKPKKCRECKNLFEPFTSLSICCSIKCSLKYNADKKAEAEAKNWNIEKRKMTEKLKTHSDWLNDLERVFNKFIRLRDQGQGCISCGTKKDIEYHAGHFYAAGNYSYLRFNEFNVNLQCGNNCNRMKGGNFHEYKIGLIKKIGEQKVNELRENRHKKSKLSIPEIKELIKTYKNKVREYAKAA